MIPFSSFVWKVAEDKHVLPVLEHQLCGPGVAPCQRPVPVSHVSRFHRLTLMRTPMAMRWCPCPDGLLALVGEGCRRNGPLRRSASLCPAGLTAGPREMFRNACTWTSMSTQMRINWDLECLVV